MSGVTSTAVLAVYAVITALGDLQYPREKDRFSGIHSSTLCLVLMTALCKEDINILVI
jgi:hypothetical protein